MQQYRLSLGTSYIMYKAFFVYLIKKHEFLFYACLLRHMFYKFATFIVELL